MYIYDKLCIYIFLNINLSFLIYLCDIGILLKLSLGECYCYVCYVLLRILYNDIFLICICLFVFL